MDSKKAREIMCEHQSGFVKLNLIYNAIDRLINDSEKLEQIKQIVDRPIGNNAEEKAYNYMMIVKDIKEILEDGKETRFS